LIKGGGLLFEQMDEDSLFEAMRAATEADPEKLREEIRALNTEYHPRRISADFGKKFVEALGWRSD
jgi:hypothetical protein